jgi:hypothetical protein
MAGQIISKTQLIELIESTVKNRNYGETPLRGDEHQSLLLTLVETITTLGKSFGKFIASSTYNSNEAFIYNGKIYTVKTGATLTGGFDEELVDELVIGGSGIPITIINDLTTGGETEALSAEMGVVLKGLIDTINNLLTSDDVSLDELQEIVDYIKENRADLDALGITSVLGLEAALANKVDAVAGKGLSTNDFTNADKAKIDDFYAIYGSKIFTAKVLNPGETQFALAYDDVAITYTPRFFLLEFVAGEYPAGVSTISVNGVTMALTDEIGNNIDTSHFSRGTSSNLVYPAFIDSTGVGGYVRLVGLREKLGTGLSRDANGNISIGGTFAEKIDLFLNGVRYWLAVANNNLETTLICDTNGQATFGNYHLSSGKRAALKLFEGLARIDYGNALNRLDVGQYGAEIVTDPNQDPNERYAHVDAKTTGLTIGWRTKNQPSIEKTITFAEAKSVIKDNINNFGVKYDGSYAVNGVTEPYWLPDYITVQNEDKKRLPASSTIIELTTSDNGATWTGNDTNINYNSVLPKDVLVRFNSANMSAVNASSTVNIAGIGAKLVKDRFSQALKAGSFVQNKTYNLVYNFLKDWYEVQEIGGYYTNASSAYVAPASGVDTYLIDTIIDVSSLKVGDELEFLFSANKTAAGASPSTWSLRAGTTGTITDNSFASFNGGLQTGSADNGYFTLKLKCEQVGSSMLFKYDLIMLHRLNSAGFANTATSVVSGVTGSFNANTNTILGVSINTGASASWQFTNISYKINR